MTTKSQGESVIVNDHRSILKRLRIKEIVLATHSYCNFRCSFCPYPVFKENYKMSPEVVYKLIDMIGEYPEIEWVHMDDLNEPLIDTNTFNYIRALQNKGKKVCLATNGLLLGREEIRNSLKKALPDCMPISVHTFSQEDFEKTRNVKISFDEYLNGIAECIAQIYPFLNNDKFIRIEVAIHAPHSLRKILGLRTGEKSFYPDIEKLCQGVVHFIELLKAKGLSLPVESVEREALNNIRLARRGKRHQVYIRILPGLYFFLKGFSDWINYDSAKKNPLPRCHPNHLVIRANGDVIRCCYDYKGKTKFGNVFITSFKEIIESNYELLSKSMKGAPHWGVCKKCQGEPTYRGVFVHALKSSLGKRVDLTLLNLEEKE